MSQTPFSRCLLAWYRKHGRKDLPWKRSGDPYHIWVSEIMLQQTQVTTVIPYFHRFVGRFPDIPSLARAHLDEVLHHWTGLGYYARARNLHKAAKIIVEQHHGELPKTFDAVCALPGIGASTAAAILAFAFDKRHVILDGNVKRVLARYHAVEGWPGKRDVQNRLWELADMHTPRSHVRHYTQAIMDLGATVCRRARPVCAHCPVHDGCNAFARGDPHRYPAAAPRRKLPVKTVAMVMIRDARGRVLLQQRPPAGLWGGLWGFPECTEENVSAWCRKTLGLSLKLEPPWSPLRHSFSHFHLDIIPISARIVRSDGKLMENAGTVWYNLDRPDERGFAAPVKRLLEQLRATT
ncbi:MAG: A/G-specific adenine glycosylase [Acidiferrobacterales bacterium]